MHTRLVLGFSGCLFASSLAGCGSSSSNPAADGATTTAGADGGLDAAPDGAASTGSSDDSGATTRAGDDAGSTADASSDSGSTTSGAGDADVGTAVGVTQITTARDRNYLGCLTLVGSNLYWSDGTSGIGGTIEKVPTAGGTATAVVDDPSLVNCELASDGAKLYFLRNVSGAVELDATALDGSSLTAIANFPLGSVPSGWTDATQIFLQSAAAYIGGSGVWTAPIGPSGGSSTVLANASDGHALLGVDATNAYTLSLSNSLNLTPLGGGAPTSFDSVVSAATMEHGGWFSIAGGSIYYITSTASAGSPGTLTLHKLTPPATTPTTLATLPGTHTDYGIVADSAGLYVAFNGSTGTGIYQVDPTSGAQTKVYTSTGNLQANGQSMALDATHLYFVDGPIWALTR
jgi:hypothetical protein